MTREEIYDDKIFPLMKQIIDVCKEHDIPLVASFQLNDDRLEGDMFACTTAVLPKDTHANLKNAHREIRRADVAFAAITITTKP